MQKRRKPVSWPKAALHSILLLLILAAGILGYTIYLARNRDRALTILRGVKPKPAPRQEVPKPPAEEDGKAEAPPKESGKGETKKTRRKSKAA